MADPAPYTRHHRLAQTLLRTLFDAMEPHFEAKGALSRQEFSRAFAVMMDQWPRVTPLFADACRSCVATQAARAAGTADGIADAPADERRRDHLTRLLLASLLTKIPESRDPITGAAFPRVIAPGLQSNLVALFYEKEWDALNSDARSILHLTGPGADDEVWRRVSGHAVLPALADALLVRVMVRFKQFQRQRQGFMRRMLLTLAPSRFPFGEEHFNAVFEALFGSLRDDIRSEFGRARMDVRYGDGTGAQVMAIFDQFDQHVQEQRHPVRTLAGAIRTSSTTPSVRRVAAADGATTGPVTLAPGAPGAGGGTY